MSQLTYRLAVLALLLAACSAPTDGAAPATPSSAPGTPSAGSASVTASPSPSAPSTFPPVPAAPSAVTERCGGPRGPAASAVRIRSGASTLTGFATGHGSTTAVLLHQTDGDGACGWWPYASWLVTQHPVRALAIDLCGYGRARCAGSLESRPVRQVDAAVRWAREHGARRVVLVGASMGGAVALDAAAALDVDAVVDLSGPFEWPETRTKTSLPRLHVPTLIAVSDTTDYLDHQQLQQHFADIPASTKRFVTTGPGHGYSLLTAITGGVLGLGDLAEPVAGWVEGRYAAADGSP